MSFQHSEKFINQLTASQSKIFGCIMTLVGNLSDAKDILQKTNLRLWKNASRYDSTRPFLPWAIATARLEVRAYYRDCKRERLIFDEDLLLQLQEMTDLQIERYSVRQDALRICLLGLSESNRNLLALRYAQGKSTETISLICNRSVDGVKSLMLRLRKSLRNCIEQQLQNQSSLGS